MGAERKGLTMMRLKVTFALALTVLAAPALAVTVEPASVRAGDGLCAQACPGAIHAARGARPHAAPQVLPLHRSPLMPMWLDPAPWETPATRRAEAARDALPRLTGTGPVRIVIPRADLPVAAKIPVPAGLPLMVSALTAMALVARAPGPKRVPAVHVRPRSA